MKGYVALTDEDWFTFLGGRQPLDEVSFWQPSAHSFRAPAGTVTPELRFVVSERLATEWENGKIYYERSGASIALPKRRLDRPDPALLRWHNENVFEKGLAA